MNKADRAVELFSSQYNCAQAVLGAMGEGEGLALSDCLKVASAFGGGICRRAETCGAVTGALMALGLRYGGETITDPAKKAEVYARGREFMTLFKRRHGSVICRDLLGCDISTAEGMQRSREENLHESVCTGLLRDAVEIVDSM